MARTDLAPGALIDRFEIIRLLGSGGMGTVYEARDPELDRSVALKVIREPDPQLSLRLIREAQALAQLQHPNVVTVHECGADGDEVFVAMELVDGASFDRLSPKPETWREVVALFVQAGRGLAAAHTKGLVHRDVKPSNLFVGKDGRVRIGDFGLARRQRDDAPAKIRIDDAVVPMDSAETIDMLGASPPAEPLPATALLSAQLTRDGSQVGTPRYMSPEQTAGHRASAASDQYSFCKALEEMLPARVPGWLTRAVERGLARDPEARHPSMQALVDVLDQTPRRMQRRAILGTAAFGAATVVGAFLLLATRDSGAEVPELCSTGPSRMVGVWDPERRAAVERAFTATGRPYAASSFARIADVLDSRRDEWIEMHRDACHATYLHRTEPPELYDRRLACLEDSRADLAAYVDGLIAIEPKTVDDADFEASSVGDVARCADPKRLARHEVLPSDLEDRRRYKELLAALARVRTDLRLGKRKTLADDAGAIVADANAHGWPRIAGQAGYLVGAALILTGNMAEARGHFEEAAKAAALAGDDWTAMKAWINLLGALVEAGDVQNAKALLTVADTAILRAGHAPSQRSRYLQLEAWVQALGGDMRGARASMAAAVDYTLKKVPEEQAHTIANALGNLAMIESQLEEFPSAIEHRRQALAISTKHYGELHPVTMECLGDLGQTLGASGDRVAARAALEEAVAALEKVYGPESPALATQLQALANAQEKDQDALPIYERIVAIHEKAGTAGLGRALVGLAQTRRGLGDQAGAEEAAAKAMTVIEKRLGKENMEYAAAEATWGWAVGCNAKSQINHAIEVLTREVGADNGMTRDAIDARKSCN